MRKIIHDDGKKRTANEKPPSAGRSRMTAVFYSSFEQPFAGNTTLPKKLVMEQKKRSDHGDFALERSPPSIKGGEVVVKEGRFRS
ncbi:hypothetical protein B9L19_10850 [Geobacillus thermocatenulatus]|uniref:Uncharacterized protein n=3 Tax=Geobacillus TaxID=129337 RepID=A0A226Q371_9BACL|nr:hypothetical protein GT3921_11855 [Geobacillus thermocatenulatus]OXB86059.1 hypothetical protein B9L19_10850 [Geobacillus thermocatenulatus]RAN23272.1 hypothetical protein VC88_07070 [Geobacillus sp. A8]